MKFTEMRELRDEDMDRILRVHYNNNGTEYMLDKMTGEDFGKFLREAKKKEKGN